jgi:hypothetical protein
MLRDGQCVVDCIDITGVAKRFIGRENPSEPMFLSELLRSTRVPGSHRKDLDIGDFATGFHQRTRRNLGCTQNSDSHRQALRIEAKALLSYLNPGRVPEWKRAS